MNINMYDWSYTTMEVTKMMKKVFGLGVILLLVCALIPLSEAHAVSAPNGAMRKTVFIGRFTIPSRGLPLGEKNIVGWVIGNSQIKHYRGALPDISGNFQGIILSPFVVLIFNSNPFN
jgi:hypothetical protein